MTSEADSSKSNDRMATRQMMADIHRILVRWDPLCVKGLRGGADRTYEPQVGSLLVMVKKSVDPMTIAKHLADVMANEWGLPPNNAKCVDIARRLYNVGAVFRGEPPLTAGR